MNRVTSFFLATSTCGHIDKNESRSLKTSPGHEPKAVGPGYCSPSENVAFADIPNGLKAAPMVPLVGAELGGGWMGREGSAACHISPEMYHSGGG